MGAGRLRARADRATGATVHRPHSMRRAKEKLLHTTSSRAFTANQRTFSFKTIGLLAAIGRRTGVARFSA